MTRYAVIPTRDRRAELYDCIQSLDGQVDYIIVVDNGSTPPISGLDIKHHLGTSSAVIAVRDEQQPPNLSELWNIGISLCTGFQLSADTPEFWIAIVNDDAIVPAGWFDTVQAGMVEHGSAVGCTSEHHVGRAAVNYTRPVTSVFERITGWAFILRGSAGICADDRLRWWYGDTDIDRQGRLGGGTLIGGSPIVINRHPNASTTGVLAEQAGRDRATYIALHGPVPW